MSVNLTLEEVPFAILEAVKARILANRRRAEEEKKRRRRKTEEDHFVARRVESNDEFVSSLVEDQVRLGFSYVWWNRTINETGSGYIANWRVASGDWGSYLSESFPLPDPPRPPGTGLPYLTLYVSHLSLPIGASNTILVIMGRADYPFTSGAPYATFNRAYVASNSKIRRIGIPGGLQGCINGLNPDVPISSLPSPPDDLGIPIYYPAVFYQSQGIGFLTAPSSPWRFSDDYHQWSPSVYELLNQLSPFVSSNLIKTFPPAELPITWDFSQELKPPDQRLQQAFAQWLGNRTEITFPDANRLDLLIPFDVEFADFKDIPDFGDTGPGIGGEWAPKAWDWNAPDYCRFMCKALGFSDEDLIP